MNYGYFDDEKREYVITRPDTPLPWINYLGCEEYFGIISNTAGGYSFYRDARLRRLTRYRYNNVPFDLGGRLVYLRDNDSGAFWWGTNNCTTEEYNLIWQFTVTYLRDVLNVHNLIYAISPISFTTRNSYLKIYPGDDYVDILGMDFYYWYPLADRQKSFINSLHIPAQLALERGKVPALTEVGLDTLLEPSWFNRYLLPPFKSDSLAMRMAYTAVWRNESVHHHFAPYPGHPSVPGFLEFYNDPYTAFERDLPPMYIHPGSDQTPPSFTITPDTFFIAADTIFPLYFETDERAHLGFAFSDIPYNLMSGAFLSGQGGFKHSTLLALQQGEERTFFIRAIDISGNETPEAFRVTVRVDTLQRRIPWYDDRYPAGGWKSGAAPLGYGAAAGNATTTAAVKAFILSRISTCLTL